jgi:hypothetical protein
LLGTDRRCCEQIKGEIGLELSDIVYWTDSMTVIHYLRSPTAGYPASEASRIELIRELSPISNWCLVPTELNPAETASGSKKMSETKEVDAWVSGAECLWRPGKEWPRKPD